MPLAPNQPGSLMAAGFQHPECNIGHAEVYLHNDDVRDLDLQQDDVILFKIELQRERDF